MLPCQSPKEDWASPRTVGRLLSISENTGGTQNLVSYTYLGMNTIVKESHPQVSGGLNLSYGASGTCAGWDRFGQTASKEWAIQAHSPARAERATVDNVEFPLWSFSRGQRA